MRHPQRPPRRRRHHPGSAGFTLIELLVVIGIIALLTVALVVGLSGASGAAQERATNLTLEKLRTMTDEAERSIGSAFYGIGGAVGFRYDGATVGTPPNQVKTLSAVNAGQLDPAVAAGESAFFATEAMRDTLAIMASLQTVPTNVDVLSALDDSERFPIGIDTSNATAIDGLIQDPGPSGDTLAPSIQDRMLLVSDAWGFPIIYCPGTGDPSGIGVTSVVGDAGGLTNVLTESGGNVTVISSNGKGFWVSPGPDGLYQTDADNVYSTEVKIEPVD
ncbi:MAG: type II secretion system protein [Planctomycetota bacterium]